MYVRSVCGYCVCMLNVMCRSLVIGKWKRWGTCELKLSISSLQGVIIHEHFECNSGKTENNWISILY